MAGKKLPLQWILAFALTPVVVIAVVLFLVFGGGREKASLQSQEDVNHAVRVYPSLKPDYKQAMSDKILSQSEANSILNKANALTAKGKGRK